MAIDRNQPTFAELMALAEPEVRQVCEALRATLASVHGGFVELVWLRQRIASYGIGPKKQSQHYAFIAPLETRVKFGFYRGAFLNDPEVLLMGRAPRSRHVMVSDVESARSETIKHLLRQAVSERLASRH